MPRNDSIRQLLVVSATLGLPLIALWSAQPGAEATGTDGNVTHRAAQIHAELGQDRPNSKMLAAISPALPVPDSTGSDHWFDSARQELQRQGATYLCLERWNQQPVRYHFRCEFRRSEEDSPKLFTGSGESEHAAVEQVVNDVRRWQAELQAHHPVSTASSGQLASVGTN